MTTDRAAITGTVVAVLTGPDGSEKSRCEVRNLVTQIGDQYYMERAADTSGAPSQVTGMKLGTGDTTPAKTGGGAALAGYLDDSHQAIDSGFPSSSLDDGQRRITWQAVWSAGKATTESPITEVVLVNDTLSDETSAASATVARALLTGIAAKGSEDTLTVTWHHDLEFNA